ncbi:unnamed protein product [Acanthoscelides obtectus]|uniref:Uncharacterized protein n=1 Tax=Acanthoscelides obtectus TaxID=200917 RepID=A0A9P0LRE8_ACAOB|nr:unnamed protein product [Acanthoscelides obtectus]CAK1664339.1 hypothetical protein AOBTE_LOCUS24208 [Acanthoscelides obtectus]
MGQRRHCQMDYQYFVTNLSRCVSNMCLRQSFMNGCGKYRVNPQPFLFYFRLLLKYYFQMNNTWTYWSTQCCKYRRHNEVIFIATSIAVLILTSVFYLIVQFCEEKKAPTIMQRSSNYRSCQGPDFGTYIPLRPLSHYYPKRT